LASLHYGDTASRYTGEIAAMAEATTTPEPRGRRGASRRAGAGAGTDAGGARGRSYRELVNPFTPVRIFSDDEVERIHQESLVLLERRGLRVLSARGRRVLAAAGAMVDEESQVVRLDRALVEASFAKAPATIDLVARNPERSVRIGERHVAISPVAGPPNVLDAERGKRPGTLADYRDFVRLAQAFDVVHLIGQSTEALDVAPAERHLQHTLAQLTLGDKAPYVYCRGDGQIDDCFAMLRIAHGIDEETFATRPVCYTIINTNSPLQLDVPMTEGILNFARNGQVLIITPFTLAGAMAPVTIAGALLLAHAEALFGITLAQIVRPGTPVIYGTFTSNVDMRSGSPAFGTPEFTKAAFGAGQLARRIGIPWRSSSATASNAPDAQAAYESQMSLWGALLGGCNFILHGAGWLEGGLTASFEKFVLDVEMLQMFAEVFRPVLATSVELGLDAIAEVGPGGHFFATAHTMERYRTAFYSPLVSDWRNYGAWFDDGALTATQRATRIWKSTLGRFEPPAIGQDLACALEDYVARRSAEGGAAPVS
jgi:trimethylamine---corrinoid protein Co-methyltransferase